MKGLKLMLMAVAILAVSCNRHSEPPFETPLEICESYLPQTLMFDKNDSETAGIVGEWYGKTMVVNSADGLPDDPIGFTPGYSKINFKEYTLLIAYHWHRAAIDAYSNRWVRNNVESTYDWDLRIGVSSYDEDTEEGENIFLTRFAIKVRKLPADAAVNFQYSLYDLGWNWTD